MNDLIKNKMISIKKLIMIYKVQLKVNKNLNKKVLGQLKVLVRKLKCGQVDIDDSLSKIKANISGNGE